MELIAALSLGLVVLLVILFIRLFTYVGRPPFFDARRANTFDIVVTDEFGNEQAVYTVRLRKTW